MMHKSFCTAYPCLVIKLQYMRMYTFYKIILTVTVITTNIQLKKETHYDSRSLKISLYIINVEVRYM